MPELKDLILGVHILIAREGEVIDGVTVAADAKPDTDPPGNYTKVASCEGYEPRRTVTRITRRSPQPHRFEDRVVVQTNRQLEHVFQLQEWSSLTFSELLLGGQKPVAGIFVPNSATEDVRGWFIIQSYAQDGQMIAAQNVWGEARVEPYTFAENLTAYRFIVRQLASPLNTAEEDFS